MPADAPIHNPADDLAAGRALGAGGFAAIDFETATAARASACAVGVAVVRDGDVHEVRTWLVRPPDNAYEPINIAIHGITPDMTADCPTLAEIWPDVWASIGGQLLVAHNAAFDMSVLRRSLDIHGASCPDVPYACTYQLARRVWRGRFSYRLDDLAEEGGLHLEHHHAGSDAAVAGMLGVALCGAAGERQIVDAVRSVGLVPRTLSQLGQSIYRYASPLSHLQPTVDQIPEDSPFLDKTVVFTGALSLPRHDAAQIVVNVGGRVATSVSRKVDYLVIGIQDAWKLRDGEHSSKMLKAAELVEAGAAIELLDESDFLRMLPG